MSEEGSHACLSRIWFRAAEEKETAAVRLHDLHPASAAILLNEAAGCAIRALIVRAGRLADPNERPCMLWINLEAYGNVPRFPEMKKRLQSIEELARRARFPSEDNGTPDEMVRWQEVDTARADLAFVLEQVRGIMKPPVRKPEDIPAPEL